MTRGSAVTLPCVASGRPAPLLYWSGPDDAGQPLFAGQSTGRLSVSQDGILRIEGASRADRGYYTCTVLNQAGSEVARAHLQVGHCSILFRFCVLCTSILYPQTRTL